MKIYTTEKITTKVKEICNNDIANGRRKRFDSHYLYVCSTIRIKPLLDRRLVEGEFISINTTLLRDLISQAETKNILKNLVKYGVLECDYSFKAGVKSIGYRFTPEYSNLKWRLSDIKDIKLNTKLDAKLADLSNKINQQGNGYKVVNYWLNELTINTRQAKRWIEKSTDNEEQKNSYLMAVDMLDKKKFFRTVDTKAGRFHNNITNLKTELRQFLSIDGQELHQTDLTSSQPVFMAILMSKIPTVNQEELKRFTEVVCSGQFYEYIAKEAGLDLDLNDFQTRKEFKRKLFGGCLFDRNRRELSKWEKIFATSFPTILEAAREIKKTDHNRFAIALQKMEAVFIFNCVDIADREIGRGKAAFLTIHDSIVSTKEYIDIIEQIMTNEFETKYGISPKLKTQKL